MGTSNVAELTRLLMADVVSDMRAVPDHHVGTIDRFSIDPLVDVSLNTARMSCRLKATSICTFRLPSQSPLTQ
jgi:hypothetical protein